MRLRICSNFLILLLLLVNCYDIALGQSDSLRQIAHSERASNKEPIFSYSDYGNSEDENLSVKYHLIIYSETQVRVCVTTEHIYSDYKWYEYYNFSATEQVEIAIGHSDDPAMRAIGLGEHATKRIIIFDIDQDRPYPKFLDVCPHSYGRIEFSDRADNILLVFPVLYQGGSEYPIIVWNFKTGEKGEIETIAELKRWISESRFADLLVRPSGEESLSVVNYHDDENSWSEAKTAKIFSQVEHGPNSYALSPNGSLLATIPLPNDDDPIIELFHMRNEDTTVLRGHSEKIARMFFSQDSEALVSSTSSAVQVWDTATGGIICSRSGHRIRDARLLPDGFALFVVENASIDKDQYLAQVNLWDIISAGKY